MDYSYIGSGRVYMREIGATGGLVEIGNASNLSFGVTEEVREKKDFTQPGGGTFNEVRRISAVEMQLTMDELSPRNLARAVYGASAQETTTAITDETHTAYKGAFVALAKIPAATPAIVVTDNAGTTTYVAGVDYEVRPGGILILNAGAITDGSTIKVDYTPVAADKIEALVTAGKEYEMVFDGLNEARSGKRTRVTVHRVKLGAAQNISLIGEDYATLEATGKVLKDTTKTGAGISQYFKVQIEQ